MNFFEEFRNLCEEASLRYGCEALPSGEFFQNPVCGDKVWVQAQVHSGVVKELQMSCKGCWPVYGCLSLLQKRFEGRAVSEVLQHSLQDFLNEVGGIPASKRHAFALSHRAVRSAVGLAAARDLNPR